MGVVIKDLTFSYGKRTVLRGVSFRAEKSEVTSILGANGVGKSTLFRCMLGLSATYGGSIEIDGMDIRETTERELARKIAYIPQAHSPAFNYTVFDAVLMGTSGRLSMVGSPGKREIALARDAMEKVGIAHLAERGCLEISGGELQLMLIARALAQDSKILVLDEPTANLDFGNQLKILAGMRELAKDGYTIIQSTHNPDQSNMFSDRVVAMKDGSVLADGAPATLFTPELINGLYGVDVDVESLCGDRVRVCVPRFLATLARAAIRN